MTLNPAVPDATDRRPDASAATYRSVAVSLAVNSVETVALAMTAWVTGAVALRAQTAANAADTAVEVFLLIGVLSSACPPDDTHPLGYGRERFFWSLFAVLGIFIGGSGLAFNGALRAALDPSPIENYAIGYIVLATVIVLDVFALVIVLRQLREEASACGVSLRRHLHRSTDPASVTVAVGGACAVAGGIIALLGLLFSEQMGNATPDTVASALIGIMLFVASIFLLRGKPRPPAWAGRSTRDRARNAPSHRRPRRSRRRTGLVRRRRRSLERHCRRRHHLCRRLGSPRRRRDHQPLDGRLARTLALDRIRLSHACRPSAPVPRSTHDDAAAQLDREHGAEADAGGHVGHGLVDLGERTPGGDHSLEVEATGPPQRDQTRECRGARCSCRGTSP